ncbi:hypothetical protein D3C78_988260 [compost metagenome]
MIDTVGLGNAKDSYPFLDISWGIASEREDQAVMFAAEKGFLSVDCKLVALRSEFLQTKDKLLLVSNMSIPVFQNKGYIIKIGSAFTPEQRVLS